LSAAINGLNSQLKQLASTQRDTASSAREAASAEGELAVNMHESRGAAKLFSEELGVNLNRHLAGVLAQSSSLGPLLSAAFPIAAAIGFIEVISQFAEKISEAISDTFIFTDAMKEEYKANVEDNKALIEHIARMSELEKEYQRVGKTAEETHFLDLADLNKQLDTTIDKIKAAQAEIGKPVPPGSFLQQLKQGAAGFLTGGFAGAALGFAAPSDTQIAQTENARKIAVDAAKRQQDELLAQEKVAAAKVGEEQIKAAKEAEAKRLQIEEATAAALLTFSKGEATRELAAQKEQFAAGNEAAKASYEQGKLSLEQYLTQRRTLAEQEATAEIAALQKSRAATFADLSRETARKTPDAAKQATLSNQLADIDAKIASTKAAATRTQQAIDAEGAAKEKANQEKALEFQIKTLELEGNLQAAQKLREQLEEKENEALVKRGELSQSELDRRNAAEEQEKTFQSIRQTAATAESKLQEQRAEIQAKVIAGEITPTDAQAQRLAAEQEYLKTLQDEAAALQALETAEQALGIANQQHIKATQDVNKNVAVEQKTIQQLPNDLKTFQNAAAQAFTGDLENFFTRGIEGAQSFGQAMRGLAGSVLQSLQQILTQMLINKLLMGAFFPQAGAAPSGGLFGQLGIGMATGGVVTGPGGPTADRVPAMLSAGEFVMSAASVKALGEANLSAINKGVSGAMPSEGTPMHFATGGLAGADMSTSHEINMGIGLDDGLILRSLGSKKATKIILTQLSNNPKAAQRALQRSD
jgi:hypothetical protein